MWHKQNSIISLSRQSVKQEIWSGCKMQAWEQISVIYVPIDEHFLSYFYFYLFTYFLFINSGTEHSVQCEHSVKITSDVVTWWSIDAWKYVQLSSTSFFSVILFNKVYRRSVLWWLKLDMIWGLKHDYHYPRASMLIWFGEVLWHINHCRLFNAKSSLYIYNKWRINKGL